jgi:CheY-like chemotaxis protein
VAQLLDLQREEMVDEQLVDLGDLVAEMRDLLKRVLGEAIRFSIRAEPRLARVRVHPARIQQVLLNLGINARDAMPDGGDLAIRLSNLKLDESNLASSPGASPGQYVLMEISDTGKGMDAPTLSQIFRPFFTTKAKGKGTGLGLFTVNTIVKQWGGNVGVVSETGRGSTFRILLPVPAGAEAAPDESPTLLLVEDEELLRRSVEAALELHGFKVLSAATADEAVRIASGYSGEIALILTDLIMPGRSGMELAQEIRQERPAMKVLFMSGYSHDSRVHDPEVSNFFRKPFSAGALVARIGELLQETTTV